ncbi:MAG: undecaprenyldiphospho-muramoylpentapeptide beta-N-acetylglucosaminyltransferase [Acidobacteria bacterium]|nr:undecaprenyldiphospho-muramoylpentapeptide beta-N-acetylglucosaminyltransferase [Acidobacteriota bacterium]
MSLSVVIAGGGTGGHLYPGIAVARELRRRVPDARVTFAGTTRGLEARIVPREGFELDVIRSAGLKGKSVVARARGAALVLPSLADAWRIVSRRRPDVVVGVGGYSSGPVVLTAALRRIPTMVLEQNAAPGLTNRLLAPFVRAAAVTYDETLAFFDGRGIVTGNPVRAEFFSAVGRDPAGTGRRVLILGGSQGAHAINMAMVAAVPELVRRHPSLEIVHQTGERDLDEVRRQYERAGVGVRVAAFLDPVVDEVTAADLVVGRAGATTLAELAAAGRPAVLIPFAAATDDHQRKNARVLEAAGAAVMIDERELTPPRVADVLGALLDDAGRRTVMSRAMTRFARPDAAARIVDRLLALGARDSGAVQA